MNVKNDSVVDVRVKGEEATFQEVIDFGKDVAVDAVVGVFDGIVNTATDVLKTGTNLCEGNVTQASEIVRNRTQSVARGMIDIMKGVTELSVAGYDAVVHDQEFMNEENKSKLTRVCQAGIYGVIGSVFMDDSK